MDWKTLVLIQLDNLENDDKKDKIFENLIELNNFNDIDGKGWKKLFKLSQLILKHKGEQVTSLWSELDALATKEGELEVKDNTDSSNLAGQNEQLLKDVEKLELEKTKLISKIKSLNEEIVYLQKRQQESHSQSDRDDSPDALSDIDRQQELLNNISIKNKHIKRLLKNIEVLEDQVNSQSDFISGLNKKLEEATINLSFCTNQYAEVQSYSKEQQLIVDELNKKIIELEDQAIDLQRFNTKRESEIEVFAKELEERAMIWKAILDQKQVELDAVQEKYNDLLEQNPGYDIDSERYEIKRLSGMIKERDNSIKHLESKLIEMTNKMIKSTKIMRTISETNNDNKNNLEKENLEICCCDNLKLQLQNYTERCKDLQSVVISLEEDNILKSKQAIEAINNLKMYQCGEDGLPQALKKINKLEQNINSRDKQIRALIMEVNNCNEYALENSVLRKKLGISEDEIIQTSSVSAKHKKIQKLNDRLNLKLRASEEMRLELKLEKSETSNIFLTKKLSSFDKSAIETNDGEIVFTSGDGDHINKLNEKTCENCMYQFNENDYSNVNLCDKCEQLLKRDSNNQNAAYKSVIEKLEENYKIVVEENENLRIGMHEILQKLQKYNAESNYITIDSTTLEKVLYALDARSVSGWYHPAMRIQNELIATKERETALRERVHISESLINSANRLDLIDNKPITTDDVSLENVSEINITQDPEVKIQDETKEANQVDTNLRGHDIKAIQDNVETLTNEIEKLSIFKKNYEELISINQKHEDEQLGVITKLSEENTNIKIELLCQNRKINFLKNELEIMKTKITDNQNESLNILSNFKKKLSFKSETINELQLKIKNCSENNEKKNNQQINDLQLEIWTLKSKLGLFTKNFFEHFDKFDNNHLLNLNKEDILKIGIINDNIHIDFITKNEIDLLKLKTTEFENEIKTLKLNIKSSHEIMEIGDKQILSLQQIVSKNLDEEIHLRHLIVDLQSKSDDKYMLAKMQQELKVLKSNEKNLIEKLEQSEKEAGQIKLQLDQMMVQNKVNAEKLTRHEKNYELKIEYLKKLLIKMSEKYALYTPLYCIYDFIKLFSTVIDLHNQLYSNVQSKSKQEIEENQLEIYNKIKENFKDDNISIENRIELIKYQNKCEYLSDQITQIESRATALQNEVDKMKLANIDMSSIWKAIEVLFSDKDKEKQCIEKSIQTGVDKRDKSTLTETIAITNTIETSDRPREVDNESPIKLDTLTLNQKSIESQLKQAMTLATTRNALLLETENRLAEAQSRIKSTEKILEEKNNILKDQRDKTNTSDPNKREENMFFVTISTFQKLLLEKDSTLARYQSLLRTEREEQNKTLEHLQKELTQLKETVRSMEKKLLEKDKEIRWLQNEKADLILSDTQHADVNKIEIKNNSKEIETSDNILIELSDNLIENMFLERQLELDTPNLNNISLERKLSSAEDEIKRLESQLRDVSNREKIWERNMCDKDKEITLLIEKLNSSKNFEIHREVQGNSSNHRKIEQLQELLEEKDRHIQDLTDTLTQFHDDQQKFITDTSLHSAEHVAQLSADLSRCEGTNRVLNTQIEVLKRQITSLSQREKQARELVKNFRNQLSRRPTTKSVRISTSHEDQLNRKIKQLQNEICETKNELERQNHLVESRRAKSAADLDLWSKQKHWQLVSEKLKSKLKEKETDIEKLNASLVLAKSTISRLEKEKYILENRARNSKYCTASSCPNLHTQKYSVAESSGSYTSRSDFENHQVVEDNQRCKLQKVISRENLENYSDMIEALKSRIESQQRKIVAMELQGRGSNAMSIEIENLQEKISSLEAQNIRLEAKNLQVQLDFDMMKQGDGGDRMKRQIAHLEQYILVLKDELAQSLSINSMARHVSNNSNSNQGHGCMEQTILNLRSIIEKLKVENKNLKDGKGTYSRNMVSKDIYEALRKDNEKIQKNYSEALDKISRLQIDSGINEINKNSNTSFSSELINELRTVKEKLSQKSLLLEKAKILLTRAAAKEKNLREQIDLLKRRCSELQNFPVIEETSEGEFHS